MNQPSLLPPEDRATAELVSQLANALRLGSWRHRDELARSLGVSVRAIRDAASHANGEVISGQLGLKLTICATEDELEAALARAVHQIHEMAVRVVATRRIWAGRVKERHSA